jgi:3-dehydroquinate dehydratase-2
MSTKSRRALVLNGPNLNLLGTREPGIYGTQTLADIEKAVRTEAEVLGWDVEFRQTNHEGVLLDDLHAARGEFDGIILNPSALTHTSIAIRDAVSAIDIPVVEVHISNVHRREEFRKISYVAATATATISGAGTDSYVLALLCLDRKVPAR